MDGPAFSVKRFDAFRCLLGLALTAFMTVGCNRKSDARLQDTFDNHRDDFTRLAMMSHQDRHVVRIDFNFTALDTDSSWSRSDLGFSEQRWDEYRMLFRKLKIAYGIDRRDDFPGVVFFWADCDGSAISRDCKGYAYSQGSLKPTVGDLDGLAPGVAFKALSPNWYLFRDGG